MNLNRPQHQSYSTRRPCPSSHQSELGGARSEVAQRRVCGLAPPAACGTLLLGVLERQLSVAAHWRALRSSPLLYLPAGEGHTIGGHRGFPEEVASKMRFGKRVGRTQEKREEDASREMNGRSYRAVRGTGWMRPPTCSSILAPVLVCVSLLPWLEATSKGLAGGEASGGAACSQYRGCLP